ncbi:9176_t:CDS:1, partial [Gigaspora rosea]
KNQSNELGRNRQSNHNNYRRDLIETDLEVEIIETEIIIIGTKTTLEIEITVMIEMITALE